MRDFKPAPPPIALLAELTHRCPLACPYCSNPLDLLKREAELSTEDWAKVFAQAADLGVLQVHLSGGEPLSRRDLPQLVRAARDAGLYVNLITSGIGLTAERLAELDEAGVDHVQLSLQGVTAEMADAVGGYRGGYTRKIEVAGLITARGLPLTLNAVMHRANIGDLAETIDFAARLGARRIEIACVQFYGWALQNRAALMPSREQVETAKRVVAAALPRYKGIMAMDFVPPDYYADYPKSCMGGWGSTGLNVAPDGTVLPCHAAQTIPGLTFPKVTQMPLAEIWYRSAAFDAFRGDDWMPDPCKSCARKELDHGGCRCQALALGGDARMADPVCRHSPARAAVDRLLADLPAPEAALPDYIYRR